MSRLDGIADVHPKPLVSVCIPTYRGAAHLQAAINSVLEQSLSDLELIVIDDNSPDSTQELMTGYADPRIRYLRNPENLGPEGNWNRCLYEAHGQYLKVLPQDDLLYPNTLARQVRVLEDNSNGDIALVFGSRTILDADGQVIMRRGYPRGKEGRVAARELIRRCVRYGTNLIGEPGAVLMRKSLADTTGRFDGDIPYVIDLDYWVRLLAYGDGYYLPDPVSAFRVSSGSWSVAIGSRQSAEYTRFIAKLRESMDTQITPLDALMGNLLARLNNVLRLLFYKRALLR